MIRLKNETQIDGIRKSCRLLAEMYKSIIPQIVAGMSTKDIANALNKSEEEVKVLFTFFEQLDRFEKELNAL